MGIESALQAMMEENHKAEMWQMEICACPDQWQGLHWVTLHNCTKGDLSKVMLSLIHTLVETWCKLPSEVLVKQLWQVVRFIFVAYLQNVSIDLLHVVRIILLKVLNIHHAYCFHFCQWWMRLGHWKHQHSAATELVEQELTVCTTGLPACYLACISIPAVTSEGHTSGPSYF